MNHGCMRVDKWGRHAYQSVPLRAVLEGGAPILINGEVVGAVGVSGAKSTQDVEVGKVGSPLCYEGRQSRVGGALPSASSPPGLRDGAAAERRGEPVTTGIVPS